MKQIVWKDGIYEGELFKGKVPHGKGKITYANGDTYEGDWKMGRAHGRGVAIGKTPEGTFKYEGDFYKDMMHGNGMYTFPNGDIYDGQWKYDKADGTGMYKWACGDLYQGNWKNFKKHGHGSYCASNGTRYDGDWKEDMKHGRGVEYYPESNGKFEGYYFKNNRHGTGYYTINDPLKKKKKKNSSNKPIIYEQVYMNGTKMNEVLIDGPVPKEITPPPELSFMQSKVNMDIIEEIDQDEEDEYARDNLQIFGEAIVLWPDNAWELINDFFATEYDTKLLVRYYKSNVDKVANLEKEFERKEKLEARIKELNDSQESKEKMIEILTELGETDINDETMNIDILRMKIAVEVSKMEEEIEEIKNSAKELEVFGDSEKLNNKINDLEKKIFRCESGVATAKLHGDASTTKVDKTHESYTECMNIINDYMLRLRKIHSRLFKESKGLIESKGDATKDLISQVEQLYKDLLMAHSDKLLENHIILDSVIKRGQFLAEETLKLFK